jgi:hypothetical protein
MAVSPSPETPELAKDVKGASAPVPEFGPGSKVKWDNPKNAPVNRKHVGVDPAGVDNRKLLA